MNDIQVELQEYMGSDRSIANSAWTSSLVKEKRDAREDSDVERIVKMLANDGHATPFESVVMRFWIRMPIAVDRQHMTHRIASHNGMSGRYRTMPEDFQQVPDDVYNVVNKFYAADLFKKEHDDVCKQTNEFYRKILKEAKHAEKEGIISNSEYKRVREFTRNVLPQGNMTERTTVINLRSFANYQRLRNSEYAQPEIKRVAELMLAAVKKANICPVALDSLEKNGWSI